MPNQRGGGEDWQPIEWIKNAEGYADPTAGGAWNNIREKERRKEAARMAVISNLIPILKQTAELAGFEVVGRIALRDKATGKEYR